MRFKYSMIYWVFILLLAFQTAFGQTESTDITTPDIVGQQTDWRIENLTKQVRKLFEAYDKAEFDEFVELSHPNIYKKTGVSAFYGELEIIINHRMSSGEELLPTTVEIPNMLFEADNRIFGVVTYKLNSISKNKKDKLVGMGSNGGNFRRRWEKLEICQRRGVLRCVSRRCGSSSNFLSD